MITITDGKNEFVIRREELRERNDDLKGLATKPKYNYWVVELLFVGRRNYFDKIVKCYTGGDSYLEVFKNKSPKVKNKIVLSKKNYNIVKAIWDNMNIERDYKKEAIIDIAARMFSYECYHNYILELDTRIKSDEIFRDCVPVDKEYKKYKKEIYKKAKEILNDVYGIDNLL